MRTCVLFGLLLCAACSDAIAPPCETWGGCLPGSLVVRVEILDSVFPAHHERAGLPVWGPGDTMAFRLSVENQSDVPVDSFTLKTGYGPERVDRAFDHIIQLRERVVPPLGPDERMQFVDTAVIAPETRATELPLVVRVKTVSAADTALYGRLAGDTTVPVLSSGFELGIAGVPGQVVKQVWGRWDLWAQWRSYDEYTVLLRVSNPYEAPLAPFHLTWCLIDVDYCPVNGEVEALTPEVPPGESRDVWVPFTLRNTSIRNFWDFAYTVVAICYPRWLRGTCAEFNVQLLPDFDAECTIPAIVPGDTITDDTHDCDGSGSAYRFTAQVGERYRVEATPQVAFIVGPNGKDHYDPMDTEVTIGQDGDYYVILNQRSQPVVTFTLVRLQSAEASGS